MRLLVLGGTVFLGHALVSNALRRGWQVTTLTRGRSGDPVVGANAIHGDRTAELGLLAGQAWDAVVDTCGFTPDVVAASAAALRDAAPTYAFVSSLSVYPGAAEETQPIFTEGNGYGELKAACERAVEAFYPTGALQVRAGLILGPRENIGRLPWWLRRISEGGEVVAPGRPERPLQYIDVRDLAAWILDALEAGLTGPYNVVSRPGHTTTGGLLEACISATGAPARLVWAGEDVLEAAGVEPWTELPCWVPERGELADHLDGSVERAYDTGLRCRPVTDTVQATWDWILSGGVPVPRPGLPAHGLPRPKELAVLAALRGH